MAGRAATPQAFAGFRADPEATAAYERFERINRELLALFTDWQMMPTPAASGCPTTTPTPTTTTASSTASARQHERAEKVLDRFAALEPRLGEYTPPARRAPTTRCSPARHDWVSGARIDSYHTVWFELHEDLLRMLGREREEAP